MMRITWPPKAYWGCWLLAAGFNFVQYGLHPAWRLALCFTLSHFVTWALLGLIAMPMFRRVPLRLHWRPVLFHLVMGALFVEINITIGHLLYSALTGASPALSLLDTMIEATRSCFYVALLIYWAFLGVVQGLDTQKLARQREVQIAEHKTTLVRLELQTLKIQLQPHFLFNTLNAIASLMHYDIDTADRMLNRLSELLRISLQDAGSPTVHLRQEIDFIHAYLDIEKIRFDERLRIDWQMPAELLDCPVPPFILQPLVENAIKFGVAPHAAGGSVTIRAHATITGLTLEVENDVHPTANTPKGFGIGLGNTRSRLATLYGNDQRFELVRGEHSTIARIHIPSHDAGLPTAPEPAHA